MSYPPPGVPHPQPYFDQVTYPPPVAPQHGQQPYQQPYQQTMPSTPPPKNGIVTAGLVLGIVGFVLCWVPGLGFLVGTSAIIFSAIALSKASRKVKPIIGLALGIMTVLVNAIVTASLGGSSTPEAASVQDAKTSAAPVQDAATSAAPVVTAPTAVATVEPAPVVTTKAPAAPPTVEAKPPAEPAVATSFGDGSYEVGVDVAPGKYKSTGATEGLFEFCSVSTKNSRGDTVDWETANANEQVLITIKLGQTVEASGCEQFRKR